MKGLTIQLWIRDDTNNSKTSLILCLPQSGFLTKRSKRHTNKIKTTNKLFSIVIILNNNVKTIYPINNI